MATTARRGSSRQSRGALSPTVQQPTAHSETSKTGATGGTRRPRASGAKSQNGELRFMSHKEGREYFDREVRKRLGISGKEFLRHFDAGEYRDIPDDPEHWPIIEVGFLIPFGR